MQRALACPLAADWSGSHRRLVGGTGDRQQGCRACTPHGNTYLCSKPQLCCCLQRRRMTTRRSGTAQLRSHISYQLLASHSDCGLPRQADEDQEKRRARAERFGVEYRPKDETGLMDVGEADLLLLLCS